MSIKVILSTLGPLHLIKSAEYLSEYVDIKVIQGWIPKWWNRWFLTIASKLVGRDLYRPFKKRTPHCLEGRNTSIGLPEFYLWWCKLRRVNPMTSSYDAAMLYGRMSKKYIQNADIFHVRSGSGLNGAIEKAKALGMKVVVDHSIAHPAFMDKQLRNEYEKNNVVFNMGLDNPFWKSIVEDCKKGDVVLVNSEFVKSTFVENGFDPDKIKVILLGVREDFRYLKSNYDLSDDGKLRILFTGGFGFRKGAEYILRALCELDKEGFNYEMTVVGQNSAHELLKSYHPKNIKFEGTIPQDDLKEYLANSDVYLFPSLCEGCASSGMEAMAAGLPVIATNESGLPIENESDGVIIQSKNVDAIIKALKRIASNKSYRAILGHNAAQKLSSCFTWEMYAESVYSIYSELLKNAKLLKY